MCSNKNDRQDSRSLWNFLKNQRTAIKAMAAKTLPPNRAFLKGLFTALLLIGTKFLVEHHPVAKRFEMLTFSVLQSQKPSLETTETLPVVVVDISTWPGGHAEIPTPRVPLWNLVKAIEKSKARAIALDIDFAPRNVNDYWIPITMDDVTWFFQRCTEVRKRGTPVSWRFAELKHTAVLKRSLTFRRFTSRYRLGKLGVPLAAKAYNIRRYLH